MIKENRKRHLAELKAPGRMREISEDMFNIKKAIRPDRFFDYTAGCIDRPMGTIRF
ncbi:hypothetical protein [Paenibacillus lactis]|uniref:hypothetical protein n=1 Tax=Paenibacillus lactis TaxID=228574 RepID=UPI0016437728